MEPKFFRCGHVRDAFNTMRAGKRNQCCRTCGMERARAWARARFRRLRNEGLTTYETHRYRPLTQSDLASMLQRMGDGKMTMCQATAGPSGYQRSTLYRKIRIWAPDHRDRFLLIKRLSKLNVSTQRRLRWEARRPVDEPDTFPGVDPENLDFDLLETIVRSFHLPGEDLRADIRQALVVDLLEGRTCYNNLRLRARQHVTQHFKKSNSKWGHRSMDETISPDSKRTLGEGISHSMWG